VVAVRHESKRQRETREQQRPRVQVGDRAPVREADAGHAVVEVLAVGAVDRLPVLQALEHDERRVQERHGEQYQRQHERDDRRDLHGSLDRDHPHQQPEQVGPTIAHEARSGREVIEQEAERSPGGERREHARLRAGQVEGDHGHGRGDDHADACRQAVDAVGEVDNVHHHHQTDHREDRPGVGRAHVGEVQLADERQRDRLHGHAEVHDDDRRENLTGQLQARRQLEAIVERTHQRDHRCADEHAMPQFGRFLAEARRKPDQPGDKGPSEDRQAAEQRLGTLRQAALAGLIDRADGSRQAHRDRSNQGGHRRRRQEGVKRVELVQVRHRIETASHAAAS
jgi:hypothetical protein